MWRRASEAFRRRRSSAIVQETRGVPFQIYSYFLAGFFTLFAVRDMFFCGRTFTNDPLEERVYAIFSECSTDVIQEVWSGLAAVGHWVQVIIRIHMARTKKVADLYHALILIVFMDSCHAFLALRMGLDVMPPLYKFAVVAEVTYESYVLFVARKAFIARSKKQDVRKEPYQQRHEE